MLIRFEDVHKSYGGQDVLTGVTFQVNPGEHVGLVGRNGAGKTTLFRLLAGTEEQDKGRITSIKGIRLGFLAQQPVFDEGQTVREEAISVFAELRNMEVEISRLEHLMAETSGPELDETLAVYSDLSHRYEASGGFTYGARADAVLAGLGFSPDDFSASAHKLSGGQKARLALTKLLLAEPDILLLDEPTNHLDVDAVEWLEDFLAEYKNAFVIISHDRFLLDRTATRIIEIEGGIANSYPGNYTAYMLQKEQRRLVQAREYDKQRDLIQRTEEFIRRNLAGQKTKQAKSRRKMLEKLDRVDAVQDSQISNFKIERDNAKKRRFGGPVIGGTVLTVNDLAIGYGKLVLCRGISLMLPRGKRLGIIGSNGSGKTTFLKTIADKIVPLAGDFHWSDNVKLAYFDQELSGLTPEFTVIQELDTAWNQRAGKTGESPEGEMRSYLARFLFMGDDVFKPVGGLSGGEKSRLALAKLICGKYNVLVLDEPTNHLDISSRESLEQALAEYTGTIITVSHDRYFLDRIASEILHFESGSSTHHQGGYTDYFEDREASKRRATEKPVAAPVPARKARATFAAAAGKKTGANKLLEQLEGRIASLEQEQGEIAEKLSMPTSDRAVIVEMGARHQEIAGELERLYHEWESAANPA